MHTPQYFPIGTLVVEAGYPDRPLEVRGIDINMTRAGTRIYYSLGSPHHYIYLPAKDVELYRERD